MYEIVIASDDEHEKVYAEIYFQEKFVVLLSQKEGSGNLKLEFPDCNLNQEAITKIIPLNNFINLIEKAKLKLIGN